MSGLAVLRLLAAALLLAVLLPAHLLIRPFGRDPSPVARLFLRCLVQLWGLKKDLVGPWPPDGPCLHVANHVSWADILILGAATRTSFVAKREVRGWPVLGWLAAQHGTLFVDRGARTAVTQQRDEIVAAVRDGRQLTLFAEGTSSDGSAVLPFKSALFSAAYAGDLIVRPVTIAWVRVGGAEICDHNRRDIAWIEEMTLAPHLWRVLRLGGAQARLVLHDPVRASDFPSRHALARHCRDVIVAELARQAALRNRSE
jgi:1-acyl-sn-glycerol-3-phosphate acyltransferase